jgi:hypothetical protein
MTSPSIWHWALSYGARLECRYWGDECLVHHALSNDTHRIAAWVGPLLIELSELEPSTSIVLAQKLDLDPGEVAAALEALAALDLVVRC